MRCACNSQFVTIGGGIRTVTGGMPTVSKHSLFFFSPSKESNFIWCVLFKNQVVGFYFIYFIYLFIFKNNNNHLISSFRSAGYDYWSEFHSFSSLWNFCFFKCYFFDQLKKKKRLSYYFCVSQKEEHDSYQTTKTRFRHILRLTWHGMIFFLPIIHEGFFLFVFYVCDIFSCRKKKSSKRKKMQYLKNK